MYFSNILRSSDKVKRLRTDNGTTSTRCSNERESSTNSLHHHQNGVTERANRTIMDRTKGVIDGGMFPKKLWAEIAEVVVYLKNRRLSTTKRRTMVTVKARCPTDSRLSGIMFQRKAYQTRHSFKRRQACSGMALPRMKSRYHGTW